MKIQLCGLALVLVLSGCDGSPKGEQSDPATPTEAPSEPTDAKSDDAQRVSGLPPIEIELPAEAKTSAEALAKSLVSDNPPKVEEADVPALLWLAANSDDAKLVARALVSTGDATGSAEKIPTGLVKVATARIKSQDPNVFDGAINAMGVLLYLSDPLDPAVRTVLEQFLGSGEETGRKMLVAAVLSDIQDQDARIELTELATDPDKQPAEVIVAAFDQFAGLDSSKYERMAAASLRLLSNDDALVRGRAALVYGTFAEPGDDEARKRLEALVADQDAFVRANAIAGLGKLGAKASVGLIASKLTDDGDTKRNLVANIGTDVPYPIQIRTRGTQVGDSAVWSLIDLSKAFGQDRFDIDFTVDYNKPETVHKARKLAADWASKH